MITSHLISLTTLKSLTKKLNHLDHIKRHKNCTDLRLFSRKIQDVVLPKETLKFPKRSPLIFCRFLRKRV